MSQDQKIAELRDNAIAEVEYLEAQRVLRAMKGFPLTESLADNNFVDPYEYLRDQGQWSFIGPTNAAIGAGRPDMRGDRDHGRDWPLFQTETELGYFRAMGRAITNHIPAGINILESLTNYVVGTGMQFECRPVGEEGKELAERVQRVVDQFLDDNDFVGDLDRELHARSRKDGEFFVKVERVGWRTRLRVIEPACVTEPMDANTLCDALDCGGPCDWRFGIHTAANDTSRVYGYHVVYDGIGQDWEYLSADQCEHFKRNTDRNVKRGVSDFYPVDAWLKRTEKLLRNTTGGAAIQAAIAFIREHGASVSASSVETFRASKAWDTINRNTPAGFQSKSIQKFDEGTVLDVGQQKYSAGPMGAGEATAGYIAVLQAALRYVGIRWSMPEYLISGDASNANYASTKESGTPFVKAREADQAFYVSRFRRLAWKAVKNAVDGGALGGLTMEQITQLVDIHVAAPRVDSRDSINETTSDKTLVDAGAMSVRTMAIRAGLDYDREVSQGAKAAAPPDIGGMFGRSPQDNQQPDDWSDSQDDDGDTEDIEESYDESDHPRDENGQWTRHVGGASHGYTVAGKSVAHLTHKGGGKYSVMIQHPTEKKHKEIEISAESTKEAKELAVKAAGEHRSKARESAANADQKKATQIAHYEKLEASYAENINKAKKNIANYEAMIAKGQNVDTAKKALAGQKESHDMLSRELKTIRGFLSSARSDKGKQVAESAEWTDGNILESAQEPDLFSAATDILWGAYP